MQKLNLEKWIDRQQLSRTASWLFSDSIKCYKAEAHRAALLFSYLAFMTVLKERILGADEPALLPVGHWQKLLDKLQDEDKWESATFDATQEKEVIGAGKVKTKDPVFSINDGLRTQIKYWKDRRNDCAHFKDNEITTYHVASFWSFLESNLAKITVEGGKSSLLKKLSKHYDDTQTSAKKDVAPLLLEIDSSVDSNDLADFWGSTFRIIASDSRSWNYQLESVFIDKVLAMNSPRLTESLLSYIKTEDKKLLSAYLVHSPSVISLIEYTEEEIRKFWRTNLRSVNRPLTVFAAMLAHRLIPKEEIEEANGFVFELIDDYTENLQEHFVLQANGFGNTIERIAFAENHINSFMWTNNKADLLLAYVKLYPLRELVVKKLCGVFNSKPYSYWLAERLEELFDENVDKSNEFVGIAQKHNFTLPRYLPSLQH